MEPPSASLFIDKAGDPTTLRRLAELYVRDVQTYGRLATLRGLFGQRRSAAELAFAELRCTWVANYLQLLEEAIGLRFGIAKTAYCRAGEPWDATVAPAGFSDEVPAPRPSDVVTAMCRCWNLAGAGARQTVYSDSDVVTSGLPPPSSALHFLSACLWMCHKQGLASALEFVFQLQEAGFFVDGKQLVDLVDLLLLARCQVQSDVELVSRFCGGNLPPDPIAWSNASLTLDWIRLTGVSERWHFPQFTFDVLQFADSTEVVQPLVIELVEHAVQAMETVRSSTSWDEWLVAQLSLGVRLEVTLHIVSRTIPRPTLSLRTILSQFQEVRADVSGLANGVWLDPNLPSFVYGAPAQLFQRVATYYRKTIGAGWQDRLFARRTLVPHRLKPLMLDGTTRDIPPEWDALSWQIAHAVCMALRSETYAALRWNTSETDLSVEAIALPRVPVELNRVVFDLDPVSKQPAVQEAFERFGINDSRTQHIYLRRIFGGMAMPSQPADSVSETSYAVTLAAEATGASWPQIIQGLEPATVASTARTIVRYDICLALSAIRSWLCQVDVDRVMATSLELLGQGRLTEALELLDAHLAIYPWHRALHHQRAVALDMSGKYDEAVEPLLAALLLDQNDPEHWNLLAATLERLGHAHEASIARGMGTLMNERRLTYRDI